MKFLAFFLSLCTTWLQAELNLEEKVGQIFLGFFHGEAINASTKDFLQRTHLGNVVYYQWANGLTSPEQVAALSDQLQQMMPIRPFIAIDQEGGRVARLRSGFTHFESNLAMASFEDPSLVYLNAKQMAKELAGVGITMNLAPVVDVNSNPDNPVIGDRSYSHDPKVVSNMAKQFMTAHHELGIKTVLKHFPGHGDTDRNSHYELPTVLKSREELEQVELRPFRDLATQADAIMTAHIFVPSLDPHNPATFSPAILNGLLRQEWGFKGLIISDSLVMRAIAPAQTTFEEAVQSVAQAAIKAFNAGCDCLIVGALEWGDFPTTPEQNHELLERVMNEVVKAVREGRIAESRLNESLERIFLKKYGTDYQGESVPI